jgi:hypothetical protein
MLAGLTSTKQPSYRSAIRVQHIADARVGFRASSLSMSANPRSNSLPWLPTRYTPSGSPESSARSASERPEISATAVWGSSESVRSATIASRLGFACVGSLTIGAIVPS